jgi:hypothetical protein
MGARNGRKRAYRGCFDGSPMGSFEARMPRLGPRIGKSEIGRLRFEALAAESCRELIAEAIDQCIGY